MTIKRLQKLCHKIAVEKGFWKHKCGGCNGTGKGLTDAECEMCKGEGMVTNSRNDGEIIALIHSELSEALEALRKDDIENLGEELADTIIRIMDYAEGRKIDLEKAILKKVEVNKKRPQKHGKKF